MGPDRAGSRRIRCGRAGPLRGRGRRVSGTRSRTGRDVQPFHLAALVRRGRSLAGCGRAGAVRALLRAAEAAAGVQRYRASNVMQREDFAGMREGMTAAHRAAVSAIKAQRSDLPVGLSIAITDDQAVPGGEKLRDRKRAEVYDHWLRVAADDDFIGVQNYERITYGPDGAIPVPDGAIINDMGTAVEPGSLGGAARYAHQVSGRPVLVTEHGIGISDD